MTEEWIKKGVECCEKAEFEQGIVFFDKALKKEPTHTLGLHNRARALSRIGELEKALADFEQLTLLFPNSPSFISDYAVALHLNDNNEKAALMFERALEMEPENPYRYSSRAYFKDRMGDFEGAIADYDKAIALDPDDAIALNNKGLIEEKLGYKEKANQSFKQSNTLVGYQPEQKAKTSISEFKPQVQAESAKTRWSIIKSVFTKDGFKDFVKFTKELVAGK